MRMRIFPNSKLLETQLKYYVRGDESRWAQNAIIEFAISLKTRKRNIFTTHLNVGLQYSLESMRLAPQEHIGRLQGELEHAREVARQSEEALREKESEMEHLRAGVRSQEVDSMTETEHYSQLLDSEQRATTTLRARLETKEAELTRTMDQFLQVCVCMCICVCVCVWCVCVCVHGVCVWCVCVHACMRMWSVCVCMCVDWVCMSCMVCVCMCMTTRMFVHMFEQTSHKLNLHFVAERIDPAS